jgi:hypothetical protein
VTILEAPRPNTGLHTLLSTPNATRSPAPISCMSACFGSGNLPRSGAGHAQGRRAPHALASGVITLPMWSKLDFLYRLTGGGTHAKGIEKFQLATRRL